MAYYIEFMAVQAHPPAIELSAYALLNAGQFLVLRASLKTATCRACLKAHIKSW